MRDLYSIAPEFVSARTSTLDVFSIPLNPSDATLQVLRAMLSDDETARADRFRDPLHGRRFTAARAALRIVLGTYTERDPASIIFDYGPKGKPFLSDGEIHFNLSHSGDLAVVALRSGGLVGIDVERFRDDLEDRKLAKRFFSTDELADLDRLHEQEWQQGFYTCWTRKEAYMKAVGDGFSITLDSFRVSVLPDVAPALLQVTGDIDEPNRWAVIDIHVPQGFRASAVTPLPEPALRQFDLRWH